MTYCATALQLSESLLIFEQGTRYWRWVFGCLHSIDAINPWKEHCSNSASDCPKERYLEGLREVHVEVCVIQSAHVGDFSVKIAAGILAVMSTIAYMHQIESIVLNA